MIYVASPYSHENKRVEQQRFLLTESFVNHCLKNLGVLVFSPIVYTHKLAVANAWPTDAGFYMTFNMNMLRRAESMFELRLEGWEMSKGMEVERKIADTLRIPIAQFDQHFNNLTTQQALNS